jgi:pimeloyl-ACP methyl ester carboxylesterase
MGFRVVKTMDLLQPDDSVFTRPGVFLDAGSTRLNFYCMGQGSPSVIFEAGYSDWSPAWVRVLPRVAQWTRACAYDRAGSGFSDPGKTPRSSSRIADELLAALRSGGISGPYILVGHSYGGVNVRTFALRHMDETAGLVLVDGDSTDVEPPALQEADHRAGREIVAAYSDCRDAVAAGASLSLPARKGHPAWECDRYFFRGLPEAAWSRELNAKVAELARTNVAMFDALASEMAEVPADEAWLREHRRPLGSRPIRVLSSGHHGGGPRDSKTPEGREYQRLVSKAQADWLELSTDGKQVFATGSSEYIQLDEPDVVIGAIREVYEAVRRNR